MIWVLTLLLVFSVIFNIGLAALYGDYRRRLEIALATIEVGDYIMHPKLLRRELQKELRN